MKKSFFKGYQWHLLVLSWGIALGAGVWGFYRYAALHGLNNSLWDDLYLTLQLIPMNSGALTPPIPLELQFARFLIPFLAAATAVNALWNMIQERLRSARLTRLADHIIICGLGRKGVQLANRLRQRGDEVVIIERDAANEALESCKQKGIFTLLGDASEPDLLRQAGLPQARALIAVCSQDGDNAEIALRAQSLVGERSGHPLTCMAHITDPQLCALLRENEKMFPDRPYRMELFNIFELGARKLLQQVPAWDEQAIHDGAVPHLLVSGIGRMGENLVIQAARDWWRQQPDHRKRFKISVVDRQASLKTQSMGIRYPHLNEVCEMIPLDMDVHSPSFERGAFLFDSQGKSCVDRIYICLDNDALGLHAALTLSRQIPGVSIPIVIRMSEENGLGRLLEDRKGYQESFQNLVAFNLLDQVCTPDLLVTNPVEVLARAAHSGYVQQQMRTGTLAPDDPSIQPWEKLSDAYRQANYQWVEHVSRLLDQLGYKIVHYADWDIPNFEFSTDELGRLARLEHELWCEDRSRDGWRYNPGPKNLAAKTSPNLVSWEQLSPADRELNFVFVRSIPETVDRVGYKISR